MININELETNIEALYPHFQNYEKNIKGFKVYPSIFDIKEWFRFLEWCKLNDTATTNQTKTS